MTHEITHTHTHTHYNDNNDTILSHCFSVIIIFSIQSLFLQPNVMRYSRKTQTPFSLSLLMLGDERITSLLSPSLLLPPACMIYEGRYRQTDRQTDIHSHVAGVLWCQCSTLVKVCSKTMPWRVKVCVCVCVCVLSHASLYPLISFFANSDLIPGIT